MSQYHINGLWLIIYVYYSWEMAFKVGHAALENNMGESGSY
jgi:hypothetical protein